MNMARNFDDGFRRGDDWDEQRARNERRFRSGREGFSSDRWESSDRGYGDRGYGERGYGERGYGERGYGERGYGERGYGNDERDRGYYSQQVTGQRGENSWERNRPWEGSRGYLGESNRYGWVGSSFGGYGLNDAYTRDYGRGDWYRSGNTLRGGFSGKGPRDYTRSDDRIREDVCDRLSWDDEVDASDITVTVSQGEVTLEGNVPDRHSKRRAEDISEVVMGVKDVHNRLKANKGLIQEVGDKIMGRDTETHGHAGSGTRNQPAASTSAASSLQNHR
jgi:osmotically-inducible protein OsmY